MTNIEWTHGLKTPDGKPMPGKTWNPMVGCTEVSRGCRECYAARMAWRLMHNPKMSADYQGTAKKLANGRVVFTGKVNLLSDRLSEPLETKRPTVYFVNSMSDLFHEDVPSSYIYDIFRVMDKTPQHIYQVLTKRPGRMKDFLTFYCELKEPIKNVWIGVSVEDQKAADQRRMPLKYMSDMGWLTWVSNEPCVGPINWKGWEFLKWMVTGGESGAGADPMHPDWARKARDFCAYNKIPWFFKQWGAFAPWSTGDVFTEEKPLVCMKPDGSLSWLSGDMGNNHISNYSENYEAEDTPIQKGNKHDNGRILDGRTHDAYPVIN